MFGGGSGLRVSSCIICHYTKYSRCLQVFVHYLFQAIHLVAMTLVSAVSTPGHRDDGIHLLSFVLNDLILLMEYFTGESKLKWIAHTQTKSI